MNNDLISRSALLETIHKHHYRLSNAINTTDYGMFTVGIDQAINEAPAVDAVEVVRCKDCKWFNSVGCAIYIVDESDKPKENDFCSFGERRADE